MGFRCEKRYITAVCVLKQLTRNRAISLCLLITTAKIGLSFLFLQRDEQTQILHSMRRHASLRALHRSFSRAARRLFRQFRARANAWRTSYYYYITREIDFQNLHNILLRRRAQQTGRTAFSRPFHVRIESFYFGDKNLYSCIILQQCSPQFSPRVQR